MVSMNTRNDYSKKKHASLFIWAPDCCFNTDVKHDELLSFNMKTPKIFKYLTYVYMYAKSG